MKIFAVKLDFLDAGPLDLLQDVLDIFFYIGEEVLKVFGAFFLKGEVGEL